MTKQKGAWEDTEQVEGISYTCGFCGSLVGPSEGYVCKKRYTSYAYDIFGHIFICTVCNKPTYRDDLDKDYPSSVKGNEVEHLDKDIQNLYNEARNCISVNAFTAAVLAMRKLLMNVSVDKGADEGKSFVHYVDYLNDKHFVPPNSRDWVDHIRRKGNEATHEIPDMSKDDAEMLLNFVEMLLRNIYEMPGKMNNHIQNTQSN